MRNEEERMKSRLSKKILKFETSEKKKEKKVSEDLKKNEALLIELEKTKKELEKIKNSNKKDEKLEKELKKAKEKQKELEKEKAKYEEVNRKKIEEEKKKEEELKRKKEEEEFGPSGIGIYDRRSIIKQMRKKETDDETLEKAFNPPAEVLSIRYRKLLRELLYALFFTIIIGTFHLLMFKEIEFPKILPHGIILFLTLASVFFLERGYRKNMNVNSFIRAGEFFFVAGFLMYFTETRYISSRFVTLILPIISVILIIYYILKVIIIEKFERNIYINSLSDIKNILSQDIKSQEVGMLYNKNINKKKLTYLLGVLDGKNKKTEKENKEEIKIDLNSPYKKENRTKKEQENFNKWKAKVKS